MKPGVQILRELAFKEPGTMAMGFIIYPVHNDPKNINNLRYYDIVGCSWEEALEKVEDCKKMINKNSRPVILKVIMEVIEIGESESMKFEEELYPSGSKNSKEKKRILEDFLVEAQRIISERKKEDPMVLTPTKFLMEMHEKIIMSGVYRSPAVKQMEERFTF